MHIGSQPLATPIFGFLLALACGLGALRRALIGPVVGAGVVLVFALRTLLVLGLPFPVLESAGSARRRSFVFGMLRTGLVGERIIIVMFGLALGLLRRLGRALFVLPLGLEKIRIVDPTTRRLKPAGVLNFK